MRISEKPGGNCPGWIINPSKVFILHSDSCELLALNEASKFGKQHSEHKINRLKIIIPGRRSLRLTANGFGFHNLNAALSQNGCLLQKKQQHRMLKAFQRPVTSKKACSRSSSRTHPASTQSTPFLCGNRISLLILNINTLYPQIMLV